MLVNIAGSAREYPSSALEQDASNAALHRPFLAQDNAATHAHAVAAFPQHRARPGSAALPRRAAAHQSRAQVVAVVSRGTTPVPPMGIFGETTPAIKIGAVPPPLLPVEKCVIVVPAAPLDGKSRLALSATDPPEAAFHPVDRNVFWRA
jgi:hypothetical protein